MRIYENLFIVRPDAPEEEIDALIEQLKQTIAAKQGSVEVLDKWGVRKLAYRVQKYAEGFYVLVRYKCGPDTVKEVERRLRVADLVIKFITVRMDLKLKWLEKRKKMREKRAARKPQVAAPAVTPGAPMPAPPAPSAPAPGEPTSES